MKIEKYGMAKMCGFGFISGSCSYEDGPVDYGFCSGVTFHELSKLGDHIRVSVKGYDCNISTKAGKGKYLFVFDGDDKCWKEYFTGIKVEPRSPKDPYYYRNVRELGVNTNMVFDTVYALFLCEVPLDEFSLYLSLLSDDDKEKMSNQIKWLSNAAAQWKEDCQNAIKSVIRKRDEADSALPTQPSQDDINNGFGKYGIVDDKNFNPNCSPRQAEALQKKRESRENLHRLIGFMKKSKALFIFSVLFLVVATILIVISCMKISNDDELSAFSVISGMVEVSALLLSSFANELSWKYWTDNGFTWYCKLNVTAIAVLCITGINFDNFIFSLIVWLILSAVIFALQIIMGMWGRKLHSKAFEKCSLRKSSAGVYIIPVKCSACNGTGENDGGSDICTACKGWGFLNMR